VLRIKETEDIDARFAEVENAVAAWRAAVPDVTAGLRQYVRAQLRISLIHHDAALEGDVLNQSEIQAAIDPEIISDSTLIPSYDEILHLNESLDFCEEFAAGKKGKFDIDTLKDIYAVLSPDEKSKGMPYRKENPLHRLYYHDIVAPEKIAAGWKKLVEWWPSEESTNLHVIERIVTLHQKFMAIFPWIKESGRVIRVASNMLLLEAGYPFAIIHSQDRQKYYEALRGDTSTLLSVYLEAILTTAKSELRVYDEAKYESSRRR
jgi:Fic family protein